MTLTVQHDVAVPGAEPDDNAAVRRGGRRGEGVRAGAQVARAGADEVPGAPARGRGRQARRAAGRQPLPEGAAGHHRPRAQPDQIAAALGPEGIHGSNVFASRLYRAKGHRRILDSFVQLAGDVKKNYVSE